MNKLKVYDYVKIINLYFFADTLGRVIDVRLTEEYHPDKDRLLKEYLVDLDYSNHFIWIIETNLERHPRYE